MRNFMEERQFQRSQEELDKVLRKVHASPEIIDHYRQNPLLRLMLRNVKNGKSPYTLPIELEAPKDLKEGL